MKWRTHIAMSWILLPGLWLLGRLSLRTLPFTIAMLFVGSLLPDLYHPPVKRNAFLHSLAGAVVASSVASLLVAVCLQTLVSAELALSFEEAFRLIFPAYVLHLLGDSLTGGGIYLAWPFSSRRFRAAGYRYDDPFLNIVMSGFGIISLVITIITMGLIELKRVIPP